MDRFIADLARVDGDLVVIRAHGVAYQRDMAARRIAYDVGYLDHYRELDGSDVQAALNGGRLALLARRAPAGARVLDVGVGNGSFVRVARWPASMRVAST
jgi:2-polyprenyl-3-methyl-5-hydroxy-6-metoxy-1,4-benzoquinol methylase